MINEILSPILRKMPWHSYLRAILAGEAIDYIERYLFVLKILANFQKYCKEQLRIIEIGAGPSSPIKNYFKHAILLDLAPAPGVDVVADATHLPFRGKAFDVAIAIDLIEHVSPNKRETVLSEMFRVSKFVLIHTPLVSSNGEFNARFYDYLLLKFLKEKVGINNPSTKFTLEHLRNHEPAYEWLRNRFRLIKPDWNAKIWYCIMKTQLASLGIMSRIVWFIYLLLLKYVRKTPYWGGFLIAISQVTKDS